MASKELTKGIKVEMEHAKLFPKNLRKTMAERIAKDHLKEDKNYYTKLKKAGL
jgi:ribosome recycling factor